MSASRDCGHFTISVAITGGLRTPSNTLIKLDPKFHKKFTKEFGKLKEKHETALLHELCVAVGWDMAKCTAAAKQAADDRAALLKADADGRAARRKRRLEAGVDA